jgi:hypothetical protein
VLLNPYLADSMPELIETAGYLVFADSSIVYIGY